MPDDFLPVHGQASPRVLERYHHPRHYGPLRQFNGQARITGPCGDTMEFWVQVDEGRVCHVGFTTTGCGSSRAAGSMAAELAVGMPQEAVVQIGQADILAALGGLPADSEHCALLAANTLQAAIRDFVRCEAATNESPRVSAPVRAPDRPQPAPVDEKLAEQQVLSHKMCQIGYIILVMSGKGGVGKSTVAANLAVSLAMQGRQVGLLDVDIHGPSIPRLMGLGGHHVVLHDREIVPLEIGSNLKVMSIGFLLPNAADAVIWRGPRKHGVIRQFLADVAWGALDYLVIDAPPGTGDEPLSVAQLAEQPAGAVLVATPQSLSVDDVRKSVSFCRQLSLPVLGIIENMSGLACPHCGGQIDLFKTGGGAMLAAEMDVPLLGRIPLDPNVVECCDDGVPLMQRCADGPGAVALANIVRHIVEATATTARAAATSAS